MSVTKQKLWEVGDEVAFSVDRQWVVRTIERVTAKQAILNERVTARMWRSDDFIRFNKETGKSIGSRLNYYAQPVTDKIRTAIATQQKQEENDKRLSRLKADVGSLIDSHRCGNYRNLNESQLNQLKNLLEGFNEENSNKTD